MTLSPTAGLRQLAKETGEAGREARRAWRPGMTFAVGMAGMPFLGQGAFMAIGAFGAALLEARAGWDPTLAILTSVAAAAAAGAIVGAAAVRAEAPFVAIGTWIVA